MINVGWYVYNVKRCKWNPELYENNSKGGGKWSYVGAKFLTTIEIMLGFIQDRLF